MMPTADMEAIIKNSIARHLDLNETLVFVFGSRADGTAEVSSDYDVGLYSVKEIPAMSLTDIREELEESHLPVKVDLVDFATVSESFKKVALVKIQVWNQPKKNLSLK